MRYILINWKSSDEFHLRHLQIHLCNICVFVCCIMNFFHSPHIKRSICIWIFCRFRLSVRVILWSQVFLFLSTKAEWKWPAAKRLWSHTHTHTHFVLFFFSFVSCPAEHVVHFSSIQLQIWIHRETLNEKGNFPTAYIFLSCWDEMIWQKSFISFS